MNHWLKNHLNKQQDYSFKIRDNCESIRLTWDKTLMMEDEMPVLRHDYIEMQAAFAIYATECDIQDMKERTMKWANVYTSLSMT